MPVRIEIRQFFDSLKIPLLWTLAYGLFVITVPVGFLTLIVQWNIIDSAYNFSGSPLSLQIFGETYVKYEIVAMGLASALFAGFLRTIEPITNVTFRSLFPIVEIKNYFFRGFRRGIAISTSIVLVFLFAGQYQYFGTLITSESFAVSISKFLIRGISIFALVYVEEFLFRKQIFHRLKTGSHWIIAALITASLHTLVKSAQFNLPNQELFAFFLISLALCPYAELKRSIIPGFSLLIAFLINFHLIFSLPLFGHELPEFKPVFLKPGVIDTLHSTPWNDFVSGGEIGPLCSALVVGFFMLIGILSSAQLLNQSNKRR